MSNKGRWGHTLTLPNKPKKMEPTEYTLPSIAEPGFDPLSEESMSALDAAIAEAIREQEEE